MGEFYGMQILPQQILSSKKSMLVIAYELPMNSATY